MDPRIPPRPPAPDGEPVSKTVLDPARHPDPSAAATAPDLQACSAPTLIGDRHVPAPEGATRLATRLIGPYELVRQLGAGGMGVVYLARHRQLARTVALKVLRWQGEEDGERIARFVREAQSAARLQHPGIVPIHDVGNDGEYYFYSMDYVPGYDLETAATRERPTPRRALEIVLAVARALAYAHGQRIIHRDLKPQNILLAEDGTPRLVDFGLAKDLNRGTALTQEGTVLGTPAYMPPEQAMGALDRVDERSDVYSLGAVLYFLLTGAPPFAGPTALDIVNRVIQTLPLPVRRLAPNVHPDIETVCMKCLEKEPARRYASAAALADDLHRFLDGLPIAAHPPSLLRRVVRTGRRFWLPTAAGAVSVLATCVAIFWVKVIAFDRDQRAAEQTRRLQHAAKLYQVVLEHVTACETAPIEDFAARLVAVLPEFDQVLDLDPDARHVLLRRAGILAQLGRREEAYGDLDRLLDATPGDLEVAYWYQAFADAGAAAEGDSGRGRSGDRVRARTAVLETEREGPYALANAARARLRDRDGAGAMALVERLLPDHGDRPEVVFLHAQALALSGEEGAALAELDRPQSLRRRDPAYQRLRAGLLAALGRGDEAAAARRLTVLLQERPAAHDCREWYRASRACFGSGSGDVLAVIRHVTGRIPEFAPGWVWLARWQRENGRLEEAETALTRAVELTPADPEVFAEGFLLASAWTGTGGAPDERLAAIDPDASAEAWEALVEALVESGNGAAARACLGRARGVRPDDPSLVAMDGWLALRTGDPEAALAHGEAAERAGALQHAYAGRKTTEVRALSMCALRRWELAATALERALDRDGGNARLWLAAALVRRQQGHADWGSAAREALRRLPLATVAGRLAAWDAGDLSAGDPLLAVAWPAADRTAGQAWREERARMAEQFARDGEAGLAAESIDAGKRALELACLLDPASSAWIGLVRLHCRQGEWQAAIAGVEKASGHGVRFPWDDPDFRSLRSFPELRGIAK